MKAVELEQNTDAWLKWRKNMIGASDTPIILGISPFKTALELYREKSGEVESQFSEWATRRGHALEPTALMFYTQHTGLKMKPACFESEEYPGLAASLDGYNTAKNIHVEIKCPGKKDWDLAQNGIIPDYYLAQIQHQMLVLGTQVAHYYVFSGTAGRLIVVNRDEELISHIILKTKDFMERIKTNQPPPLGARDYKLIDDANLFAMISELRKTKHSIEALTELKNTLENQIVQRCDHPRCEIDGMRVLRSQRRGVISYKKIVESKLELDTLELDHYRGEACESVSFKDTRTKV